MLTAEAPPPPAPARFPSVPPPPPPPPPRAPLPPWPESAPPGGLLPTPPTNASRTSPGLTANRALTLSPDPPWTDTTSDTTCATGVKSPPAPPLPLIVTKQTPSGTVAAPTCFPGSLELNNCVCTPPAPAEDTAPRATPPTSPTTAVVVNATRRITRMKDLRLETGAP